MVKILVVQSRTRPERIERERENFTRTIGDTAEVEFLSALDEKLAWKSPEQFLRDSDGVILGGSSDFDFNGGREEKDPARLVSFIILSRVKNFISYALKEEMPLLGVCFGHQMIAEMNGGKVSNDKEQTKFGSYEIALTKEGMRDPLFSKLPPSFFAQYSHKDSVTELPKGSVLLADAPNCRFAALRYGKKAYTVQFHPEVERNSLEKGPHHDSPEASRIVPLWIDLIVSGKKKG